MKMKEKILTIVSTVILFIPWTILPFRTFQWALASLAAEIMITCYAVFMILGGAFTAFAYAGMRARSNSAWLETASMPPSVLWRYA